MPFDALKGEVVDLFRRVFEFASSLNLDAARTEALQNNLHRIRSQKPGGHGLPAIDGKSMTREDKPFIDRVPDLTPGQAISVFTTSVRGDRLTYTEVVFSILVQRLTVARLARVLRLTVEGP